MTGNHIPHTPKAINRDQEVIDWFYQKFIATEKVEDSLQLGVRETTGENELDLTEPTSDVSKLHVNEIIQQDTLEQEERKFERLFDGDIQGYASASEADLALVPFYHSGRTRHLD